MTDERSAPRPIGWWLKTADAEIDAAFDTTLRGTGVDRRGWQVLASLANGPLPRAEVISSLASFDPPAALEEVLAHLAAQGWVDQDEAVVRLTPSGVEQQRRLAPLVGAVRQQISVALPPEDYLTLVSLLSRLVGALRSTSESRS